MEAVHRPYGCYLGKYMNASQVMLVGFYVKAGVPESDATLISELFGEDYLSKQNEERMHGKGNRSEAIAAVDMPDLIALGAAYQADAIIWDMFPEPHQIEDAINVVRAANLCRAAVYAYGLNSDRADQITNDAIRFSAVAWGRATEAGMRFDQKKLWQSHEQEIRRTVAGSMALRKSKGLWSKIFG